MANGDCEVLARGIKDAHSLFRFFALRRREHATQRSQSQLFTPFVAIFFQVFAD